MTARRASPLLCQHPGSVTPRAVDEICQWWRETIELARRDVILFLPGRAGHAGRQHRGLDGKRPTPTSGRFRPSATRTLLPAEFMAYGAAGALACQRENDAVQRLTSRRRIPEFVSVHSTFTARRPVSRRRWRRLHQFHSPCRGGVVFDLSELARTVPASPGVRGRRCPRLPPVACRAVMAASTSPAPEGRDPSPRWPSRVLRALSWVYDD